MASTPTPAGDGSLDFGQAFRFFFDDPDWVKKAIIGGCFYLGGILTLVFLGAGILLLAIPAGFTMRLLQRSWMGDPRPVPEWGDYGGLMRDGLKAIGLAIIHLVAAWIVPGILIIVLAVTGGALSHGGSAGEAMGGLMALFIVALELLGGLLQLIMIIYLPAALTRMTLYQRFGAGFEFRENIEFIRRNPRNYFLAFLAWFLARVVAGFGILACCVGVFPCMMWAACVMGWSFGQVARQDAFLGQQVSAPTPGA